MKCCPCYLLVNPLHSGFVFYNEELAGFPFVEIAFSMEADKLYPSEAPWGDCQLKRGKNT